MGRWSRLARSSGRPWLEASSLRQAQDAGGSAPIPRTGGLRGQSIASPRREAAPSARRGVPRTARRRVPAPGPADPPAAVLSVAHRDGLPSRILVVDDGSEDDLAACLGPELAAARNEGLEWAVAGGVPGCRRCLECGCGAALFRRRVLQGICGPVCAAPGHGFARPATPQPEAHPRSAAGQAKVHHPAKLLGWISRHARQRLRSASPPSPCPGVLFEDGPDGVDAFAEDDFSLRPTGSTSQPIEFPGGESGRDGEVSSFPPLPPVHQRPGFRITGRHRNGGMTRGQDNPSLARDNART
jgi:hypothetical protein